MNQFILQRRESRIVDCSFYSALAFIALAVGLSGCSKKPATGSSSDSVASNLTTSRPPPKVDTAPSTVHSPRVTPDIEGVVLITIDALRADQPWVGYDKVATPNLTKLALSSIVYTRAYSLANLTTASINAFLASRYASELNRNLCTLGRYEIPGSLAPTLQAAKVATLAAHGHAIFVGHTAPMAGFDEWRLIRGAAGRLQKNGAVTGDDVAELTLLNVNQTRSPKKWFSWSHFVDPHDKYVSHAEYPVTSTGDRARYDSEVAYTDAAIGRVLKEIEANGLSKTTAIVVTADHGEAFGEHGTSEHGFSLYEEEIHVPLIIHIPGVEPRQIDVPRSSIDIAPTIADLLGVTPPTSWRGLSLRRELLNDEPPEERSVIVDVPEMVQVSRMQAVIRNNDKVVFTESGVRVYELAQDPHEKSALPNDSSTAKISRARKDLDAIVGVAGTPCLSEQRPDKNGKHSAIERL